MVADAHGVLLLGGVRADALAQRFGTPLVVIDGDVLRERVRAFEDAARPYGMEVAYAGKALLVVGLAALLRDTALSLDVCSIGELLTAEAARFPAERLRLHGCGKSDEELQAALDGRVGLLVVDNLEELKRLAELARTECRAKIILRYNTGIEAHTHDYVRTGGEHTKFGLPARDLAAAIEFCRDPRFRLAGFHSHIGSQIFEHEPFVANLDALFERYVEARRAGFPVEELIVGGGFGVSSDTSDSHLEPREMIAALGNHLARLARDTAIAPPRLGIEPGRAIVAEAGSTLYRVLSVKNQGSRRFIIVDGGLSDNPRPLLYGAYHHPVMAAQQAVPAELAGAVVCGRSCENDVIVKAELPGNVARGDLIALCTTGAYTYAMASNYNRFGKPAVALAAGANARLIARREPAADLLRLDEVGEG